jgi:hypothetical protein
LVNGKADGEHTFASIFEQLPHDYVSIARSGSRVGPADYNVYQLGYISVSPLPSGN